MATFKSEITPVSAPAEAVYGRFSNLENLKSLLEKVPAASVPEEHRATINNITVSSDTISLPAGPVGALTLRMTEKEPPRLIRLEGEDSPVPMSMMLHIMPKSADECEVQIEIDLAIPAMLKPMISGPVKKMVEQFATVLKSIPYD